MEVPISVLEPGWWNQGDGTNYSHIFGDSNYGIREFVSETYLLNGSHIFEGSLKISLKSYFRFGMSETHSTAAYSFAAYMGDEIQVILMSMDFIER